MERAAGRNRTVTGSLPACSPEAHVRWGGFALVAGGTLGIVSEVVSLLLALGVLSHPSPGYEYLHEYYRGKRLLNVFYDLPGPLAVLFVTAGLGAFTPCSAEGGAGSRAWGWSSPPPPPSLRPYPASTSP